MIWSFENSWKLIELFEPITMYNCEIFEQNNDENNNNKLSKKSNFYFEIDKNDNDDNNALAQWFLMNDLANIQFGGCINGKNNFSLSISDGSYTLYSTSQVIWSICNIKLDSIQEIHFFFQDNECIVQKIKHGNANHEDELISTQSLSFYTTYEGVLSINSIHNTNTFSTSELSNYLLSIQSDLIIEIFSSKVSSNDFNILIQFLQSTTTTTTTTNEEIDLSTINSNIKIIEEEILQFLTTNNIAIRTNIKINFKLYSITFEDEQSENHRRYLQSLYFGIYLYIFIIFIIILHFIYLF